jgi:GxxExxY protein
MEGFMEENEISGKIIGCAIDIHRELGPGLLESAYESCLFYELTEAGLKVEQQKPLPLIYKKVHLKCSYRLDLVVEDRIIVELKTVESLTSLHNKQLLTYLRIANYKLGLLINFNVPQLTQGIKRIANNL